MRYRRVSKLAYTNPTENEHTNTYKVGVKLYVTKNNIRYYGPAFMYKLTYGIFIGVERYSRFHMVFFLYTICSIILLGTHCHYPNNEISQGNVEHGYAVKNVI